MLKNVIFKIILRLKGVRCHQSSLVSTLYIGKNTRIWAFTNISRRTIIGKNCNICDRCFIEESVTIGNNVTIKTGVSIWSGVKVENDVFIGPGVQFCNDKYPRSKKHVINMATILKQGCSIGAGSVILPGIIIHERAMVGAGSVVTKDVKVDQIVAGNPAREIKKR